MDDDQQRMQRDLIRRGEETSATRSRSRPASRPRRKSVSASAESSRTIPRS